MDLSAFADSLRAESESLGTHASLFDCSALQEIGLNDVRRLARLFEARDSAIGRNLCRTAVVCAADLVTLLLDPRDAHRRTLARTFVEFGHALDWVCPTLPTSLRNEIRRLRADLTSGSCLVTKLRGVLRNAPIEKLGVEFAARQLGCSRRSLQRALTQRGTSFRTELTLMRLERAKQELTAGVSVTSLAYDLGFQNVQAFIRAFKHLAGVTPGAWRKAELSKSIGAVK